MREGSPFGEPSTFGSGPVSGLLSSGGSRRLRGDHLSGTGVAAGLVRPTRKRAPFPATPAGNRKTLPAWPCSGRGLPSRGSHLSRWWALTPPFHPYPLRRRGLAPVLGPSPAVAGGIVSVALSPDRSGWALPTVLPSGGPTFLDRADARPRPPGLLPESV